MGSSPRTSERTYQVEDKSERAPLGRRIVGFSLLLIAPGLVVSCVLVWLQHWPLIAKLALLSAEVLVCFLIALSLRDRIVRPLQTLANVVGALREEDYSVRARTAAPDDALGELSLEVNALADLLAQNRTGALEANALVQRVVEEVEIPIFTFDPAQKVRLVNSAGQRLLQKSSTELLGSTAAELGLESSLSCENETLVTLSFAGGARWFVRRSAFRQQGIPHTLVVLSDVSRALREEERQAWQRLIRVIGHELNNSLAPIKSIAGSLNARLSTINLDSEQRHDFERGLEIIENRVSSLNRFLQAYRRVAQMPPPVLRECSIAALVNRVIGLEDRVYVTAIPGPNVIITADPDQLEQMLINLLRNAAEAMLESPTPAAESSNGSRAFAGESRQAVILTWSLEKDSVVLRVQDSGPGLMNPSNAFVPFYTTKPNGSGIGLLLSRQICEAHGGSLELTNRIDERGCVATVVLPKISTIRNDFVSASDAANHQPVSSDSLSI
jgi:two-component system, NtrC family, nitrogen regulation sensor histidine kinase NtrY